MCSRQPWGLSSRSARPCNTRSATPKLGTHAVKAQCCCAAQSCSDGIETVFNTFSHPSHMQLWCLKAKTNCISNS